MDVKLNTWESMWPAEREEYRARYRDMGLTAESEFVTKYTQERARTQDFLDNLRKALNEKA